MRPWPTIFSCLLLPLLSKVSASQGEQIVVMNPDSEPDFTPQTHSKPTLADLLTIENSVSIFYSYARETELSRFLSEDMRGDGGFTVFAPTNKAVMTLPRKPHQGTKKPNEVEMTDEEFDRSAKSNVQKWVSAHIVPEHPLSFDDKAHPTLLEGEVIAFKRVPKTDTSAPEWQQFMLTRGARIISKKEASNGVLYIVDDTNLID